MSETVVTCRKLSWRFVANCRDIFFPVPFPPSPFGFRRITFKYTVKPGKNTNSIRPGILFVFFGFVFVSWKEKNSGRILLAFFPVEGEEYLSYSYSYFQKRIYSTGEYFSFVFFSARQYQTPFITVIVTVQNSWSYRRGLFLQLYCCWKDKQTVTAMKLDNQGPLKTESVISWSSQVEVSIKNLDKPNLLEQGV